MNNIRTRLFLAFSGLIGLVLAMGVVLVLVSSRSQQLIFKGIYEYTQLMSLREVAFSIEQQWRSINYFILLRDPSERDKFAEQTRIIGQRLNDILKNTSSEGEKQRLTEFLNECRKYWSKCGYFFQGKAEVLEYTEKVLTPEYNQLGKNLNDILDSYSQNLHATETTIKEIGRKSFQFSVGIGLGALLFGGFLSIVIFRSISRPLYKLETGTKIIGEGKLDYHIDIKSPAEIARLAESFNQMVKNLRDLQLQVIQMDRMSSIGQLAGGVAHEINNPLTGVLGQAQLLLEKLPADSPYRKHIERIENAAQRARRIVRALLDFAREKNYVFRKSDINKMIEETLDFCHTEIESRHINLIKNFSPLPEVNLSAGHIQQVFVNIINNAIQAMPDGGDLIITTRINSEKQFAEISFRDTGIGIEANNINHVFDPFFTTKDIGQGTGLGLTVSYGIIQRHNGEILVRSDGPGKGAEFIVQLPLIGT